MTNNITEYYDDQLVFIRKEYEFILSEAVKNPDIRYYYSLLDRMSELYQKVQNADDAIRERMSVIGSFCVTSNKEDKEKAEHMSKLKSHTAELSNIEDELARLMDTY